MIVSVAENKGEHSSTGEEGKLKYFDEEINRLGREMGSSSCGNIIYNDDVAGMLHRIEKKEQNK
jgi:hypothetical protein